MSKRPNIAEAMREASGSTRNPVPEPAKETKPSVQPSRAGAKAITGHYPPQVRYQLKLLAAEQGRTMEDMLAEGLNMLFSAYNKPEIAQTSRSAAPMRASAPIKDRACGRSSGSANPGSSRQSPCR